MHESWRWFWRDLRQGELTLLLVALIVAVAATTSLRFFSSGVEKRMQQEAARLIAADLVVRSSRPLPEKFHSDAEAAGLAQANTLEFSSVLVFGDQFQLGSVKAVSPGYPLRGEIRLRDGDRERITREIPAPGSIWLDERLLGLLKAKVGDTVQLGEKNLRISAILAYEPAQGGFTAFSPRALMHLDDVAATQVIQPGSRIRYQLLVSGDSTAVADYKQILKPQLGLGMRITDVREGRPEIGTPLTRSQSYFSLATMMAVVLAGLAIATSARRFAERHFDTLALLRCLGASRREALLRL
ncbi:MAG TPA: ABC transporter permease, partial [Moraxellaceae bacterium]